MNMTAFHLTYPEVGRGNDIWVNPDHVASVDGKRDAEHCNITFVHGRTVQVKGSVSAVAFKITEAANEELE